MIAGGPASAPGAPWDVRYYDLRIAPDFSTSTLRVVATVEIDNPDLEPSHLFGLNDRYTSVVVRADGEPVGVERESGWIAVTLDAPVREFTLTFDLSGNLGRSDGERRDVVADSSLFLLWSDRFYPIVFDDWAVVQTAVTLPPGFEVVAPGRKTVVVPSDAGDIHLFATSYPTVCFSVIADRRWIRGGGARDGILVQTLLHPESRRFADQIVETSAEVLRFYADTYGEYAFDDFTFVTIDSIYARRAFPGFVGYSPAYLQKEFTTTGHDAHETALLWWFYTLRGNGPGSFQWTEGFGDYAEILYDEAYAKPVPAIFQRFRSEYLAMDPAEDVPYEALRGNTPQRIVHGKYPWLMHLVRYAVGDDAFRRAMRLLFDRYRFRTFTMPEYVATLEEGAGQSLQWWREGWLERSGVPTISMRYEVAERGDSCATSVALEQSGPARTVPLDIGLETPDGMQVERVVLEETRATRVFLTRARPSRVVLDPHGWLPARKTPPD